MSTRNPWNVNHVFALIDKVVPRSSDIADIKQLRNDLDAMTETDRSTSFGRTSVASILSKWNKFATNFPSIQKLSQQTPQDKQRIAWMLCRTYSIGTIKPYFNFNEFGDLQNYMDHIIKLLESKPNKLLNDIIVQKNILTYFDIMESLQTKSENIINEITHMPNDTIMNEIMNSTTDNNFWKLFAIKTISNRVLNENVNICNKILNKQILLHLLQSKSTSVLLIIREFVIHNYNITEYYNNIIDYMYIIFEKITIPNANITISILFELYKRDTFHHVTGNSSHKLLNVLLTKSLNDINSPRLSKDSIKKLLSIIHANASYHLINSKVKTGLAFEITNKYIELIEDSVINETKIGKIIDVNNIPFVLKHLIGNLNRFDLRMLDIFYEIFQLYSVDVKSYILNILIKIMPQYNISSDLDSENNNFIDALRDESLRKSDPLNKTDEIEFFKLSVETLSYIIVLGETYLKKKCGAILMSFIGKIFDHNYFDNSVHGLISFVAAFNKSSTEIITRNEINNFTAKYHNVAINPTVSSFILTFPNIFH